MEDKGLLQGIAGILAEIAPDEGYKFYERVAGEILSLIQPLIEQAKQEVAQEIFREIEKHKLGDYPHKPTLEFAWGTWQELKSHYLEGGGE